VYRSRSDWAFLADGARRLMMGSGLIEGAAGLTNAHVVATREICAPA
jgi:hypothetical protein